jgi:hypothetical protein
MPKIKFVCKVCCKDVEDWKTNRSKYCSKECSYSDRKGKNNSMYGRKRPDIIELIKKRTALGLYSKENHPGWKGGKPRCTCCDKLLSSRKLKKFLCKDCIKNYLIGEKSGGWRGGVCPEHIRLRGTKEYKLWRKAVFERDHYTCVWCHTKKSPFNADHIKSFSSYPKLRFDINNGRTLCKDCHEKTETYGGRSNIRINKNIEQNEIDSQTKEELLVGDIFK